MSDNKTNVIRFVSSLAFRTIERVNGLSCHKTKQVPVRSETYAKVAKLNLPSSIQWGIGSWRGIFGPFGEGGLDSERYNWGYLIMGGGQIGGGG
jgi:hypothetical protein